MAKMSIIKYSDFRKTYEGLAPTLQRLRTTSYGIIENALSSENIEHLPLQSRVKEFDSAWQKQERKRYKDPFSGMTDLLGFRIIVFLEGDIDRTRQLVESLFKIDQQNTVDRRRPDRVDAVGYRSLHIICSLGNEREALAEYRGITTQKFEVQIRTALQHTWAEIEHKRNYKGQNVLPDDLQHRLMVLAGTLELIDREFSQISEAAEKYQHDLMADIQEQRTQPLSEIAIDAILSREFSKLGFRPPSLVKSSMKNMAIEELGDFGIKTVRDFEEVFAKINLAPIALAMDRAPDNHAIGLVRDLMIALDAEKYFKKAFKKRWSGMSEDDIDYLNQAAQRSDIGKLIQDAEIELFPHEPIEF